MEHNYFLEFRLIPALLEKVKRGDNPLKSLVDINWIKDLITNKFGETEWDVFSIGIFDESYKKTTLENAKYIAYTFPKIDHAPEAKYGAIDLEKMKYYTFESSIVEDNWVIGNQTPYAHTLIQFVNKDLSLKKFLKSI